MSHVEVSGSLRGTRAERQLAERWADFTKALSIYPETNTRVRQNLEGVLAALALALQEAAQSGAPRQSDGIPILFRENRLVYGEVEEEIGEGSTLAWLRLRLDRAALAGVEFLADLHAESLIEFSKDLLAVYVRKEASPSFEALWPNPFPGLQLIDRRFEGVFGGSRNTARYRGGHTAPQPTDDGERDIAHVLLADAGILERLQGLDARVAAREVSGTERCKATDLLDRIVQHMPAEAMRTQRTMVEAVGGILDALAARVEQHGPTDALSELRSDTTLSALLHNVSRTHFARGAPEDLRWTLDEALPEAQESVRKLGHEGDDAFAEDVDALVAETQRLPTELHVDLSPSQAELPAEELAVLLHYLVSAQDAEQFPGLDPMLDRLLANPGPDELAVLHDYLQAESHPRAGTAHSPPILRFLRARQKTGLLRACGAFSEAWVVRVFPQYFVLYLEAMSLRTQRDIDELNSVCAAIGAQRMMADAGVLEADGQLLDRAAVSQLLLQPHAARLPLARLLLQWLGKAILPEVASFLRRLDLPEPEAFLLYQLPDPEYLSVEYVRGLIDLHLGALESSKLHLPIADTLCRHIRAAGRRNRRDPGRIESIRSLARFPSANSWFMLQELSRGGWLPFLGAEPAVVRRLARSMRQYYEKD